MVKWQNLQYATVQQPMTYFNVWWLNQNPIGQMEGRLENIYISSYLQ